MLATIAQAVATHLQGIQNFTGVVRYALLADISPVSGHTEVVVTPRGVDASFAARGLAVYEYRLGVYLVRHAIDSADLSAAAADAEAVILALAKDQVLAGDSTIALTSMAIDLATEDELNERNAYRATIEATYKVVR